MKTIKKFSFSIVFIILLVGLNLIHHRLYHYIRKLTGEKFFVYVVFALFVAFFLVLIIKMLPGRKNLELALIILSLGLVFFFIVSRPLFSSRLNVLEFFLLGFVVAIENKKAKSFAPFVLILAAALLVEIAGNLSLGSSFYYLDVWVNVLTALCGYVTTFLLI